MFIVSYPSVTFIIYLIGHTVTARANLSYFGYVLVMVNLDTKFEVSNFVHSRVIAFGSVCNNRRNSGNSRQNDINRCKILDFGVCIEYNSLRSDVYNGLEDMTETATVLIVTTTAH